MNASSLTPRLSLPLRAELVGMVTSFAEQGGLALGLGGPEALSLTLACEEVFAYMAGLAEGEEGLTVLLHPLGYAVRAEFILPGRELDLSLMNLTAQPSLSDETQLAQLGLLIASRSVEHFYLSPTSQGGLSLSLVKEKAYPAGTPLAPPAVQPLASFSLAPASPAQLKDLAHLLAAGYAPQIYPPYLAQPGRLVDMVSGGEYGACLALGPRQALGGAMLWRHLGQTAHCYGPYLFGQPPGSEMAAALVEGCLAALAKSEALSLICRYPTPELPQEYFEHLGELELSLPQGRLTWPHFYRQLREDPGALSWCHPCLEEFLRAQYARLFLARDLRLTQPEGEARAAHSLLGARFDRTRGTVTLRLMQDGRDLADNLSRHVKLLAGENLPNVHFRLDLGDAAEAAQAHLLQAAGFVPRLILPWGGRGDLAVYQLAGGQA